METEKAVGLRLKSVKPEKIVPHFVKWLSLAGKVEFGEGNPLQERQYRRPESSSGIVVSVTLNGIQIGTLDFYIDPPYVVYEGKRPLNISIPVTNRWQNQEYVTLGYGWYHLLAKRTGRSDGWPIPFP